jgi:hypothetical protein
MGIGGKLDNPSPSYNLAVDMGFPTGRTMRYHVEIGYQNLNDYSGLRVAPLTLGYEIPIEQRFLPPEVQLDVEILLGIISAEVLFNEGYSISLASNLRAQVVLSYEMFFAALTPIGFEVRYAYGVESVGIRTGAGVNWPFHLWIGVSL